jgi:hypothetical protein
MLKLNGCRENDRERLLREYYEKVHEVKKMTRQDKRKWVNALEGKAKEAAYKGNAKELCRITRQLSNKGFILNSLVKDKKGRVNNE